MKPDFRVHTFGCKVNTYDTGLLQKHLLEGGFELSKGETKIHILNSCAVTQEATREAARKARKIKRDQPDATVVLTGCAAQVDGKIVDAAEEIDLIVANSHKGELADILTNYFSGEIKEKVYRANIFRNEKLGIGGGEEAHHTRSFLKIQDGCNSFCTFCIIPYARGKSRSLPVPILLQKINELTEAGVKEVVLTGVHIGDYLDEETPGGAFDLADLVEEVLLKTSIPRIRLTSLEPIELGEKLFEKFQDERMCNHFHMSIQSANTEILAKMKRKYTAQDVEWSLNEIAKRFSDPFVGMDVIVGFPGETDKHFQDTYDRLNNLPWTRIHVFPYSERDGTRAPLLDGSVPVHVRKERGKILRQLSSERFDRQAATQLGQVKKVLLLNGQKGQMTRGLSRDYWDIFLPELHNNLNQEISIKVTGYNRDQMGQLKGYLTGVAQ